MAEYFILANSFAAPFFSDEGTSYAEADTPEAALEKFAADYKHPAGLYAANAYASSDAYHKGEPALARWRCNKARVMEEFTSKGTHSIYSADAGTVEIDGEEVRIEDPKAGAVIA